MSISSGRKRTSLMTALFSTLLFALSVAAAEQEQETDFQAEKVAEGLYMLMGVNGFTGGNIAISFGDDGVVMIDDSMPPFIDKLQKAVTQIAGKPVDFLINTHVHGDHTGNNATFGEGHTRIFAHENLRKHMLEKGVGGKPAPASALPVFTFNDAMNFHLNGHNARVFHVEHAHTDGDAVIFYQDVNVIHTGDVMFNGMFPFIDLKSGGSVDGYIKAQQAILSIANDQTKIIPGHGPLASKADLQTANDMLIDAKNLIQALIKKGMSEDEVVAANPLAKYAEKWNWQFITTERMTKQIYQGLK